MYGFCKNDSRIYTKAYREYNLFYYVRFPRLCLHYNNGGDIEKKELMTHCKEFNDCLIF